MGLDSQPTSSNPTLNEQLAVLLDKRQRDSKLRKLTISQSGSKDFSSNDYLSLRTDPFIKRRLIQEISTAEYIGSGGSRLLDGNSAYYEDLETLIARFHRAEAGLLFNSGYDANSAVFGTLPQPGDIVVYDELIHASVHNGIKLCRASQRVPFRHNSISNAKHILGDLTLRYPNKNIFVAVESVYSMDGDRAPLKEFVEILSDIPNSYLIVDEAHSTGVLGGNGQGLCHSLGIEDKVAVRVHTFGKAMAANGAIVLGSNVMRSYLINYARPLIYSTAMSFPALAAIKVAYDVLRSSRYYGLHYHLWERIYKMHEELKRVVKLWPRFYKYTVENPQSPIFSLECRDPKGLAIDLQRRGFVVRAIMSPTVPKGSERVRICVHAGNSLNDIVSLADAIKNYGQVFDGFPAGSSASKL